MAELTAQLLHGSGALPESSYFSSPLPQQQKNEPVFGEMARRWDYIARHERQQDIWSLCAQPGLI
jgi:hypothetical protein